MNKIAGTGIHRATFVETLESRLLMFGENIVINSGNYAALQLYSQAGTSLVTSNNYPTVSSSGAGDGGSANALVVDKNNDIQLFTGGFTPFLQRSNGPLAASNSWTTEQTTINTPGWSLVGRTFYGGLATVDHYVFATDMSTGSGGGSSGLIRFDANSSYAPTRFASGTDYCQVTLGMDGNIYGMVSPGGQPESGTVNVFNPNTLALVRSIALTDTDDAAVVADAQGNIYTGAFDGTTRKISASGTVLATAPIASTDLQISTDGKILSCAGGQIRILDENLNILSGFSVASPLGAVFACWDTYQAPGTAPTVTSTTVSSSSAAVTIGSLVTFTATVTPSAGSGFETGTVQFFDGSTALGSAVALASGANSVTYTTSALSLGSHSITAVYSGDANFATSTSAPFALSVNSAPTVPAITAQPQNQSVIAGQTASFTAAASGVPAPVIQWAYSVNGGASYTSIPGATSLTYSLTAALSETGYLYEAIFYNSQGSVTTTAASLNVASAPSIPVVTTEPASQSIPQGQPVSFTASATGAPQPAIQWQVSTNGGSSYRNISGAASLSYGFTTVSGQSGELFRAVFSNSQGSVDSAAATLTLTPPLTPPVVSAEPVNQSVLSGDVVDYVAAATGNPAPSVQWQVSSDNSSFTDVAGATLTTLSFVAPFQQQPVFYRAVFTNSQGSAISHSVTLSVMPATLVIASPPPGSVSAGQPFTFSVNALGQSNAVDTNFNGSVSVALSAGTDPTASLSGLLTVPVVNGVATFSGLAISQPGAYALAVTSTNAAATTVPSLTITAPVSTALPVFIGVSLPTTGVIGGKIKSRVPVVITNSGATLKGTFSISLYAQSTSGTDGTQYLLTTIVKRTTLRTARSIKLIAQIKTVPATLPAGTYQIVAKLLDPIGAVNLTTTSSVITVAEPFVQLSVTTGAVSPANILIKHSGSILVTLTNNGNWPTARPITLTLTPSSDGIASLPTVLTFLKSNVKIAPGKSKTYRLRFNPTGHLTTGTYYPFVSVTYTGITSTIVGLSPFSVP